MKAIGIVGIVVAIVLRLFIRELPRQLSVIQAEDPASVQQGDGTQPAHIGSRTRAKQDFLSTVSYVVRLRSFWLLTLAASFRQLGGNVFGYYMPGYLSALYPDETNLLSRYGIIVGVVGSCAVVFGGLSASLLFRRTPMIPLYMTAFGGMISSIFVLLMVFSRSIAGGSEANGVKVLYGVMCVAYLTAETWLGAFNSLLVLLLQPRYKTFGLAIYMSILVLIYSTGPQIISLALRNVESGTSEYITDVRILLAVLIPAGYWLGGIGFLWAVKKVRRDIRGGIEGVISRKADRGKKIRWIVALSLLACIVITLFVLSLVWV